MSTQSPAEIFTTLRRSLFHDNPELQSATGLELQGVVCELGMERGTALVAGFRSGAASMYLSTGGGVIGGEGHAPVRAAARQLCAVAEGKAEHFSGAEASPDLPAEGTVTYSLLSAQSMQVATHVESELQQAAHPLHELYCAMHELLTALRETQEGEGSGASGQPGQEDSYVNGLLTTLTKSPGRVVSIDAELAPPDLLEIAADEDDCEWIRSLDIDRSRVRIEQVLARLDGLARYGWLGRGSKGTLTVRHARPGGEVADVTFDVKRVRVGGTVRRLGISAAR
ncbi:MAG: hypothetical protein GY711_27460 [bacterium]|nr:hypothetical protein [bacterium]